MLLLLGAAITASFFDSLNPSAIAEQILLQTMVRNKRHILFFIAGIGFANLAMGLAIYYGAANWASQAYPAAAKAAAAKRKEPLQSLPHSLRLCRCF